jgi:hypothetical protein
MLLLTILFAWLLVSLAILALCMMARVGDLQTVDINADFDPSLDCDDNVLVLRVKLDSGETEIFSEVNETQAA